MLGKKGKGVEWKTLWKGKPVARPRGDGTAGVYDIFSKVREEMTQ